MRKFPAVELGDFEKQENWRIPDGKEVPGGRSMDAGTRQQDTMLEPEIFARRPDPICLS